jgi:hypothetical protein
VDLPPSSHFIYIPVVVVLGVTVGFILGGRATRDAIRVDEQRAAERARRKAERRAADETQGPDTPAGDRP